METCTVKIFSRKIQLQNLMRGISWCNFSARIIKYASKLVFLLKNTIGVESLHVKQRKTKTHSLSIRVENTILCQ